MIYDNSTQAILFKGGNEYFISQRIDSVELTTDGMFFIYGDGSRKQFDDIVGTDLVLKRIQLNIDSRDDQENGLDESVYLDEFLNSFAVTR